MPFTDTNRSRCSTGTVEKFITYLHSEGCIQNNEIGRKLMENKFNDEFAKKIPDGGADFGALLTAMRGCKLLQILNKRKQVFCFDGQKLQQLLDTVTHQKENGIVCSFDGPPGIGRCDLCDQTFDDECGYVKHLEDRVHKLRRVYRTDRQSLSSTARDVAVFLYDGSDREREELYSLTAKAEHTLTIANRGQHAYTVEQLVQLYPNMEQVRLGVLQCPAVLAAGAQLRLSLRLHLELQVAYLLPVLVQLRSAKGHQYTVLKELVFYHCTQMMRELRATEPYRAVLRSTLHWEELPVIRGMRPERLESELPSTRRLLPYRIPSCLRRLLDCGFCEFPNMSDGDRRWLHAYRRLQRLEQRKEPLGPGNHAELFRLMIYLEEYQETLDVHAHDCSDQTLEHDPERPDFLSLRVPGLAEGRPSLMRGDSVLVRPPGADKRYEGVVHQVQLNSVELGFDRIFLEHEYQPGALYDVSFEIHRMPYMVEQQALELARAHCILPLLFPQRAQRTGRAPCPDEDGELRWHDTRVAQNPQQQQAVRQILRRSAHPHPYLVFGPPGTGKTATLVEAVFQVWRTQPDCRVLVSTPSNSAANEVTERLVACGLPTSDLFRMVSHSVEPERLPARLLPYSNCARGCHEFPPLATLLGYRVLVLTLHTAARLVAAEVPADHFSYVVVDEAGHATEPQTLVAVAGVTSSERWPGRLHAQLVLAGDPQQLGPVVHSGMAERCSYGVSLLERLMTGCPLYQRSPRTQRHDPELLTKLLLNYRSHAAILHVPNRLFYGGELQPRVLRALHWPHLPRPDFPLVFHHVSGAEEREQSSPSFFNLLEVEVVLGYLQKLVGQRLGDAALLEEHVGVVTPYRKQAQKLQRACQLLGWKRVLVDSVEHFQGQERPVILISTVRSCPDFVQADRRHKLGFVRSPKRFNVSVTRAMSLLIVVGNERVLGSDPHWSALIRYCRDNGAVAAAGLP